MQEKLNILNDFVTVYYKQPLYGIEEILTVNSLPS